MNRRAFLTTSTAALAGTVWSAEEGEDAEVRAPLGIPLRQEPLPFEFDALEPHLDATTLKLHYQVHHAEILSKLRETLQRLSLKVGNTSALLRNFRTIVIPPDPQQKVVPMGGPPRRPSPEDQRLLRAYCGGHANHTVFWRFLAPPGAGPKGPEGKIADALKNQFGSIETFKAAFTAMAMKHFGSGWVWLIYRADGKLAITTTRNEDSPMMQQVLKPEEVGRPVLCLDLWEHAYYVHYKNDRKSYVDAWWNVVNWGFVSQAYGIVTSIGRI